MVDFETNAGSFQKLGVTVVAASVDSVEQTTSFAEKLDLSYVKALAGLDALAVADATGAAFQPGDKPFLHATGFLLNPAGEVVNSVYSSGPIGRFVADDVLKKVTFEQSKANN